jgi:DNA-binding transcriptional LysR family regulator
VDTRLLQTFRTLAETCSFTATARRLAFAQSTVSAQVQALEQELGARLFERLPEGAVLTPAGERLLPLAEGILALEARARDEVAERAEPAGAVRLVAPDSLCGHRVPDLAARLRDRYPGVRLEVSAAGTDAALRALAAGAADLAVVFEQAPGREGRTRAVRLGTEPLAVVCPPDHRLVGRSAGWAELVEERYLLLEEGCGYSDAFARRLQVASAGRVSLSRFGSVDAVRNCVMAGLGLSVLPRVTVDADLRAGRLAVVGAPATPAPVVSLVVAANRPAAAAVDLTATLLREAYRPGRRGARQPARQPARRRS